MTPLHFVIVLNHERGWWRCWSSCLRASYGGSTEEQCEQSDHEVLHMSSERQELVIICHLGQQVERQRLMNSRRNFRDHNQTLLKQERLEWAAAFRSVPTGLGFVMHTYPAPRRWATIFRPAKRDSGHK